MFSTTAEGKSFNCGQILAVSYKDYSKIFYQIKILYNHIYVRRRNVHNSL